MQIRLEFVLRAIARVADAMAELRPFAANDTSLCHRSLSPPRDALGVSQFLKVAEIAHLVKQEGP